MHIVRIGLFAIALAVPPPLLAQEAQSAKSTTDAAKPDFAKEFQALVEKFEADSALFMKPVSDAKTDEDRNKAYEALDQTKNPAIAYRERFNDLADRAEGTETGARALLYVITNLGPTADGARRNLNILLDDYMSSRVMIEVAQVIGGGLGTPQQTEGMLNRILEECPVKDAKANALAALANHKYAAGANDEAKELFAKLKADFADTEAAKGATGALFEMEHLQVGMTAPEIEAIDQDGHAFKLSDYKGKVVVIDFWGFW